MPEFKDLHVTQEDIDAGCEEGKRAHTCPFARAATRLFGTKAGVVSKSSFAPARIHVYGTHFQTWNIDDAGGSAIRRYDGGDGMEPGTYTITKAEG